MKCKEKTTKVLKSSVREYVYDFRVMLLKQDTDLDSLKKKQTLQILFHKNDQLGEDIFMCLTENIWYC